MAVITLAEWDMAKSLIRVITRLRVFNMGVVIFGSRSLFMSFRLWLLF